MRFFGKKWPWAMRRAGESNGRAVTMTKVNDKSAHEYATLCLRQ